jgi:hypothetical protein
MDEQEKDYWSSNDKYPQVIDPVPVDPQFGELSPEQVLEHVNGLRKKIRENANNQGSRFPVDVFPDPVRQIIYETNRCLRFPVDFIGASLLFASSVAIGNTYSVEILNGYTQNAVLYVALVGQTGTTKTPPVSFALKPIEDLDKVNYRQYLDRKKAYQMFIAMSMKEREKQGNPFPEKPVWSQYLVSDFTPEALVESHFHNPRGIGVYSDELAGWIYNFNRYSKGNDEQFWLSNWSGKPIRINRKTSDTFFIPRPFISVIGTIQPAVLSKLMKDRVENGFIDRLLFVFPESLQKEYWSEEELSPEIPRIWEGIIKSLLGLPLIYGEDQDVTPVIMPFDVEAKLRLRVWQRKITDLSNHSSDQVIPGIYAKMEQYASRFALCLELLRNVTGQGASDVIALESVEGAIKLAEYFTETALKVHTLIAYHGEMEALSSDKKDLYQSLPESFTTAEGVQVAKDLGIPERTFKSFIARTKLLERVERGKYKKRK